MDDLRDLAASHDAVFTIADARACGLTEKEIRVRRDRDWLRLHEGVYIVAGAPHTPRAMIRAACLAGAPNAAASHRAAAALHGLPGGRQDIAEVTCPRWVRTAQPGLVVHESKCIDPGDVQEIDGISVTRPERDQEHTNPITIANDNDRRNAVIRAGWFPLVARHRDLRDEGRHLVAAIRALRSQPA